MPSLLDVKLKCVDCGVEYAADRPRYTCDCGGLLDVALDVGALRGRISTQLFDSRLGARDLPYSSGVWRFSELLFSVAAENLVSAPEGNTHLYESQRLSRWVGLDSFLLKHEGENPTGSFKDRGMTVGVTVARLLGARTVACASTGNTSASMAAYAARAGMRALVFVPEGKIAYGKLSQALAYGATTVQIEGDFDAAMALVREVAASSPIYLLNSLNPFRLEGQKTIMYEVLQQLRWSVPDWVVVPGGNLGNSSAFGKALHELHELGLIGRLPRLAIIQAEGANPLYRAYRNGFSSFAPVQAQTIATAIKIGNPVSYTKAKRAIEWTDGVVEQVTDVEIMDAKAQVDAAGVGCEPASAASVAGTRKLVRAGVILPGEVVVAVLTGHLLKDPDSTVDYHLGKLESVTPAYPNAPLRIKPTLEEVLRLI